MKKLLYFVVATATLLLTGCESFLDTEDLTHKNTSNYPQTETDAEQVVASIYNNLNVVHANPAGSFTFLSELACDDRFGGGGKNDLMFQAEDLLMTSKVNEFEQFWKDRYVGIFRANTAIETLGNCTGYASDDQKNQMMGEAYFLRALYYYELASEFENVPLVITSASNNPTQAKPVQTWGQIMQDLLKAINLMPAKSFGSADHVAAGHADHWGAQALLARAFLFYTGFYGATGSPLEEITLPNGTTLTKAVVAAKIDSCVNHSGYSLVPDFRNLWAYSNRLTKERYGYTKGQGLKWVEDDNAVNPESMFAVKFSKFASWSTTIGYSNGYALYMGMRTTASADKVFPFGQGWGSGPINPGLWKDWTNAEPNDIRRKATICEIPAEIPNYTYGGGSDFVQETDYYGKKWSPITSFKDSVTDAKTKVKSAEYYETFEQDMYGYTSANFQLSNIHDLVLIRFADVLLMQSELNGDATGMNRVRTRAGLPGVTYSLTALQNERRWELACEGLRWNDIRRWHIAETALANQVGQNMYYCGENVKNTIQGSGYVARYKATNGGFFPIPENQIALSNGMLVQNAGWGTSDATYSGWVK